MSKILIQDPPIAEWLFSDTRSAILWLVIRLYVGWVWLEAGFAKIGAENWTGSSAGKAVLEFMKGALSKTEGAHPDVSGWYAEFLNNFVIPYPVFWSYLVAYGEFLVGLGLILGTFAGIAAFFGAFMNLNYLFAGTVSVNPLLFTLSIGLILAWKVAGYIGGDRYLLPLLGTPWRPGRAFAT